MPLSAREQKLGQTLVRRKLVDEMQLASALASAEQWGQRLTQAILHLRLTRESDLVDALAAIAQTPQADLRQRPPEPAALATLDADFCQKHGVLPFALTDEGKLLHVAMADPTDISVVDQVTARRRVRVKPYVVGELVLQKALQRYYMGIQVSLDSSPEEAPVAELDEIKLVDASGKTLMLTSAVVSMKELAKAQAGTQAAPAPVPPPAAPAPPAAASPVVPLQAPAPAAAAAPAATAPQPERTLLERVQELEQKLAAAQKAQTYAERVLRSLLDVLLAKGTISGDELKARMSQYPRERS